MNLKKIVAIAFVLFLVNNTKAQDTLYKTNGSKIIAKITEINNSEIKYKMLGSNSDLIITENKNNVHHIVYANGTKEFYNTAVQAPKHEPADYVNVTTVCEAGEKKYGKNLIAINFYETFFTNFGVSYERVSNDGKFSFKIPFSFGLGGKPNQSYYNSTDDFSIDYMKNKIYGTGLELNAYPVKFNRSGFYIGLSGEYGTFNYYAPPVSASPSYNPPPSTKYIGTHYAGLFHIGGYIGLTDKLLLGGKMALGYKHQETIYVDYTKFKVTFDLNLAYRF